MSSSGNLWAELVGQETVDEIADSFFTTSTVHATRDEGLQERGSENYLSRLVGCERKSRKRRNSELDKDENQEADGSGGIVIQNHSRGDADTDRTTQTKQPLRPFREYESESEVSSGGLSDDSITYVRQHMKIKKQNLRKRFERYKKEREDRMEEASAAKIRKVEDDDGVLKPLGSKEDVAQDLSSSSKLEPLPGTSKTDQRKSWKTVHLERLNSKDDEGLAYYITKRLKEKKHFLIQNAVAVFGRETCIRLFLKANKISFNGGILIKRRDKKRTMGGIFMYLIKNDMRIPEEQRSAFAEANLQFENKLKKDEQARIEESEKGGKEHLKNSVLKRMIVPQMQESNTNRNEALDLDDDDNYAMDVERVGPPQQTNNGMPKREIVDYSEWCPF